MTLPAVEVPWLGNLADLVDPIDATEELLQEMVAALDIDQRFAAAAHHWLELNRAIRDGVITGIALADIPLNTANARRLFDAFSEHYDAYVLGLIDGLDHIIRQLVTAIYELVSDDLLAFWNDFSSDSLKAWLQQILGLLLSPESVKGLATMMAFDAAREVAHLLRESRPAQMAQRLGRLMAQLAFELLVSVASAGLFQLLKRSRTFRKLMLRYRTLKARFDVARKRRRQKGAFADPHTPAQPPRRRLTPTAKKTRQLEDELDRAFAEDADFDVGEVRTSKTPTRRSGPRKGEAFRPLDELTEAMSPKMRKAIRALIKPLPQPFAEAWRAANNALAERVNDHIKALWKRGLKDDARRLARKNYDNYRRRFWRQVRQSEAAQQMLLDAGAKLPKSQSGAPFWEFANGDKERLTLEHMQRVFDAPWQSVNGDKLMFSLGRENSNMLEFLRQTDGFLSG